MDDLFFLGFYYVWLVKSKSILDFFMRFNEYSLDMNLFYCEGLYVELDLWNFEGLWRYRISGWYFDLVYG